MTLTSWDVRYSIGIDALDDHHRHLFSLINTIYDHFVTESPDLDLAAVFDDLMDYTQYHFTAEELMMQDWNYPEFKAHKALHDQFVKRLQEIQAGFGSNKNLVSFELLAFLNSWLLSHVTESDVQVGQFIAAEQKKHAA